MPKSKNIFYVTDCLERKKRNKNKKKKRKKDNSDEEDSDSSLSVTSSSTNSNASIEEEDDEEILKHKQEEFEETVDGLKNKRLEERMKSLKKIYKLLTEKHLSKHLQFFIIFSLDIKENIVRIFKQYDNTEELKFVLKILPVLSLLFFEKEREREFESQRENEKILQHLLKKFHVNEDENIKCLIIKYVGLIHFLQYDNKYIVKESLEFVKKNFIEKKKSDKIISEGISIFNLLCSNFDYDERINTILPAFQNFFISLLKKHKRFDYYNSIGEFFSLIYDTNKQFKRKRELIYIFQEFLKNKSISAQQKKQIRKYIVSLENDYNYDGEEIVHIKKKMYISLNTWVLKLRYNFFKKILKSNFKNFLTFENFEHLRSYLSFTGKNVSKGRANWREKEYRKIGFSERNMLKGQIL